MSQSCYALVGRNTLSPWFVYCAMDAAVSTLKQQAVGAVFDAIIVDTFKRIPLLLPTSDLVEAFDDSAATLFRQIELLQLQNRKLVRARDLLLPRLMDGRIAV